MGAAVRRVVSVSAPSRPEMNGPAVVFGAEGLSALAALSAWVRGTAGDPALERVAREVVTVVRRLGRARK